MQIGNEEIHEETWLLKQEGDMNNKQEKLIERIPAGDVAPQLA